MRFYQEMHPQEGTFVYAIVKSLDNVSGITVELLEYDNIEALISLPELSKRRVHSLKSIAKPCDNVVLYVTAVDQEKNYIDVSKRKVDQNDEIMVKNRYENAKSNVNLMEYVSTQINQEVQQLMQDYVWNNPLLSHGEHSIKELFYEQNMKFPESIVEVLTKKIPKPVYKFTKHVKIQYKGSEGVFKIKEMFEKDNDIVCKVVKVPEYSLTLTSSEKSDEQILNDFIDKIEKRCAEHGVSFSKV